MVESGLSVDCRETLVSATTGNARALSPAAGVLVCEPYLGAVPERVVDPGAVMPVPVVALQPAAGSVRAP